MKLLILFSILLFMGCGTTRFARWKEDLNADRHTSIEDGKKFETEGNALFQHRQEPQSLQAALMKWEAASELWPSAELYAKLARGHYLYADGHLSLEDKTMERDSHFASGLGFAEKGLSIIAPQIVEKTDEGIPFEKAVLNATKESVPILYWYAANLGKWAASQGVLTKLRYKEPIKATLTRILELDPEYFFAGPWRYFGAFEAMTFGFAGGDLTKSRADFEMAITLAPEYLGTKVLWAEYLSTKTGNRDEYKRLLSEVLEASLDINSEILAENLIEQRKAQRLLVKIDENF